MSNRASQADVTESMVEFTEEVCKGMIRKFNRKARRELSKLKKQ